MLPDLALLADVKSFMSITATGDDAELSRLITAVSGAVRAYCQRDFSQVTYEDVWDGKGTMRMPFPQTPVIGVTSLMIDNVPIPLGDGVALPGYTFSETEIGLLGYRFSRGFQNIQINYTAGYATVPSEIEQAVIEAVALRREDSKNRGKSSQAMGGETTAYIVRDFHPATKLILDQYKRVVPK